jgi:hypothetical protein
MINKISNSYSISIYTSVLDVGKANQIVEVSTSLNAHSRLGGSSPTEKYWSFSKNPKEIPKENYRNGILHESSLMSYLRNNKIYVSNGEVQIGGITSFIQPRSSVEVATQSSTGSAISLDSFWSSEAEITTPVRRKKAMLNFLSSNVYEVKKGNYIFAMAPNEVDDFDYIPYMGYAFNEALDGLIVNNYLVKSGNFSSGLRDNTSFSDLSLEDRNASLADGSFKAFCEYLGKGKESGYNSTFRLKYSPASEGYATTPFEAGRTTILSRNKNTGAIRIYKTYDSYLEAELEANDNEDGNACYFDRYTGKICFCRKTLSSSTQFVYTKPIGNQPGDNSPDFGNVYLHLNTDAFDDNGYIGIKNGAFATIVVPFWKLSKNKILIQSGNTFPANCVISPYSYLNTVDSNEEVYAYYAPCIGLSTANGLGPQQHIEKTLDPWLWANQKTIAVLGKNKIYPYKITLKAVGINYLRRGERTSTFVYGPLSNQNEIVYLEGQVLSESNDPVINQEVTVFIAEGKGLINGAVSTSVITNDLGIFYATYSPGASDFNWITFKAADVLASGANTFLSIPDSYELPISSDATQTNILYMITKDDGSIGTTGIKYVTPDTQGLSIDGRVGVFINPSNFSDKVLGLRNSNSSWGIDNSNNGYDKGLVFYDWVNKENANSYIGGKIILSIDGIEYNDVYKIKDIVEIPEVWNVAPTETRMINTTFAIIADPETPFVSKIKTYSNVPTTLVSSLYPNAKVMPTVNVQIGTPIAGETYQYGENTTVSIGNITGNNFFEGDVIKVQGSYLNGTNVTHDLYLTIDQVTSNFFPGGSVVSFTTSYSGDIADHKVTSFRMLRPNDKVFDSNLMNGKRSVLARLKSTSASPTEWKHPSYDADSLSSPNPFENVYGPVMTSSYNSGGRKFLVSEILPLPNETDPNNAIAGYALIPETKANIMASTYSDNDNIIYSNSVEFEIELNNLNKGVVENLLKTVKIPYGWRIPGFGSQDASTIGVNTFFTINNIAASSKVGPTMPYVSYVNSNGINYLSNNLGVYENGSSEISFNIKL